MQSCGLSDGISPAIPTVRVMELSKAGMLEELIEHDQLNIERIAGRVFRDFEEGPLEFKPTYKSTSSLRSIKGVQMHTKGNDESAAFMSR